MNALIDRGHPLRTHVVVLLLIGVLSCTQADDAGVAAPEPVTAQPPATQPTVAEPSESERINQFFEDKFHQRLARSPRRQSRLGVKDDYDKWDDISDTHLIENFEIAKHNLSELREGFDYARLEPQAQLSYRLFERTEMNRIERFPYRHHRYRVDQMNGMQSSVPAFLINIHRVSSASDAHAYLARLRNIEPLFDQLIRNLTEGADKGILAPRFVYAYVFDDISNVLRGRPFNDSETDSTLLGDFRTKLEGLDLDVAEKRTLLDGARQAPLENVGPAYQRLATAVGALEARATSDDGVWKLPDGENYYNLRLRQMTTTDLDADIIHNIGLAEVARIQEEMRGIMETVKFAGELAEFFDFLRNDPRFYYAETADGRQGYLDEATEVIDNMRTRLDELFMVTPQAALQIKAVEAFREMSAGKAFYQSPAPDGSRPGTFYANLYSMANMPRFGIEALAYHEGIPGHHMQASIAIELEGLPKFRRFGGHTAYAEGWGLYTEYLPKEIGLYQDPYSDFGRLAAELSRACRLVVDTGIHAKRWTREQAIDYLRANTPSTEGDAVKSIERYIVMPGQATAYKIGMLKILELRGRSKLALGEAFDIREFHDVVLRNGSVPLSILEQEVDAYLDRHRQPQDLSS